MHKTCVVKVALRIQYASFLYFVLKMAILSLLFQICQAISTSTKIAYQALMVSKYISFYLLSCYPQFPRSCFQNFEPSGGVLFWSPLHKYKTVIPEVLPYQSMLIAFIHSNWPQHTTLIVQNT